MLEKLGVRLGHIVTIASVISTVVMGVYTFSKQNTISELGRQQQGATIEAIKASVNQLSDTVLVNMRGVGSEINYMRGNLEAINSTLESYILKNSKNYDEMKNMLKNMYPYLNNQSNCVNKRSNYVYTWSAIPTDSI